MDIYRTYGAFGDTEPANKSPLRTISLEWGLFVLFLWSPLSSSQLFVAAGLIRQVKILPLVAAFAVGRSITYPTYIYGATLLAHTDLGRTFVSEMTSPFALIGQTLLIVGVIALGFIKWKTQSSDSPEDRL